VWWEVVKVLLINGLAVTLCVVIGRLIWLSLENSRRSRAQQAKAWRRWAEQHSGDSKTEATYHDGQER